MTLTCTPDPIPSEYHQPGDLLLSPGGTFTYEVLSYPVCRIYYDSTPDTKYPLQPHSFEYRKNKIHGQGNYLSYLARILGGKDQFYLTDCFLKKL